jgi:hypothetical protein
VERLKLSAFSHEQLRLNLIRLEAVRRGAEDKAALRIVKCIILRCNCVSRRSHAERQNAYAPQPPA